MFVLGLIILFLYFSIVPSVLGTWFGEYVVPNRDTMCFAEKYVWGFMIILGTFQAVIVPATLNKWTFNTIFVMFSLITAFLFIVAIRVLFKNDFKLRVRNAFKKDIIVDWIKNQPLRAYIFFGCVAFVIVCYVFFQNVNGSTFDDDTYIAIAVSTLENNGVFAANPVYGIGSELSLKHVMCGWHQYIAYIAKISGIHPAILAHTVLPVLLVIVSYAIYYLISRELFSDKNDQYAFLIGMFVITLFGAYSWYTLTFRLNITIWQGKGLMASIMLPFAFYYGVIAADRHKWNIKIIIAFLVIVFAGFSASYMAIGFVTLIIITGTILSIRISRSKSGICCDYCKKYNLFKILLLIIVIALAVIFSAVYLKFSENTFALSDTFGEFKTYYAKVQSSYQNYWNSSFIKLVYYALVASLGIVCIFDKKSRKTLLYTIIIMAIVFNPITAVLVDPFLESWDTYIRLYYILFPEIIMSYVCVRWVSILKIKTNRLSELLYIAPVLVLVFKGSYFNGIAQLEKAENLYKIPQEVINISDYLTGIEDDSNNNEKDITVITPDGIHEFIRQYTSKINLVWNRWYVPGDIKTRVIKYYDQASKQGAYVVLNENNVDDMALYEESGAIQLTYVDGYYIYDKIHHIEEECGFGEYYGNAEHRALQPTDDGYNKNWVDGSGNVIYREYYDSNLNKIETASGYFAEQNEYDISNRLIKTIYYDLNGNKCSISNGYAEIRREYNSDNQIVSQSFYGIDGNKGLLPAGHYKEVYEYDEYGHKTKISYYGINEEAVLVWNSYSILKNEYDEYNHVTRTEYYDTNKEPAVETKGYFAEEYKYDDQGRIIDIIYYDGDNNRCINLSGYGEIRKTYDDNNNVTSVSYYDKDGNAMLLASGQHVEKYEYDDLGRKISICYYDTFNDPILLWKLYWKQAIEYEENGNVNRYEYYDIYGEPAIETCKCFAEEYDYNDEGKLISITYFDETNARCVNRNGWFEVKRSYAEDGSVIDEYYDINGNRL